MGPQRVVRIVRQVEAVSDPCAGQVQVALRRRRDGPDVLVPGRNVQRRPPIPPDRAGGPRRRTAPHRCDQARAEGAFVESARPAADDDGVQRLRDQRTADPIAGVQAAGRQVVVGAGHSVICADSARQQRRGRETRSGVLPGRRQHRRRAVVDRTGSCSASQPSTQPGTVAVRTSSNIGIARQARRPDGRGIGPGTCPADGDQRGWRAARRRGRGRRGRRPSRTCAGWSRPAPRWRRRRHRLRCRRRGAARRRPPTRDDRPCRPSREGRRRFVRCRVQSLANGNPGAGRGC